MRPHRTVVASSFALLLAACAQGRPRIETTPAGGIGVTAGRRLGWETKRVMTKQPPETLVAEDGTVCRVSPDRYKDTAAGARVECDWQLGTPPAHAPPR